MYILVVVAYASVIATPSVSEIAKELSLPEADVIFALDAISDPVSLYEPIYHSDDDTVCLMDQIKDNNDGESHWLNSIVLEEGMAHLNEREQKILKMRYFASRTQMEVSKEIGISQAQGSRLEKSALKQLEKYIKL